MFKSFPYPNATPSKVRMVYDAARLLGYPAPSYLKAQEAAHKFTAEELERLVRIGSRRKLARTRLTVVK